MSKRTFLHSALWAASMFTVVWAGPYSAPTGGGSAIDEPVPGYVGPEGDGFVGGENYLNPIFRGWATRVIDYSPTPGLDAAWKNPNMALGPIYKSNPISGSPELSLEYGVVSLGELSAQQISDGVAPGTITLGFNMKITNGDGYDFAVFENAFSNGNYAFLELAYVEVSSDGLNFARFPSISLNPETPDIPIGPGNGAAYGQRDATNVHNLAGKHYNHGDISWGTGFDLNDLQFENSVVQGVVDLNNISYIRLVDIPGNGHFTDSEGNPIYDAWETFGSGGFDLAGIGIINGVVPEPTTTVLVLLLAALGVTLLRKRKAIAAPNLR